MNNLLLHTCCAPCSLAVIDELKDAYDVTVFFYNPNIHPRDEYEKRKAEVIKICEEWRVPVIDMDYETDVWDAKVGHIKQEKEGGSRCAACFRLRLHRTAEYAGLHGFDFFATSLTSGRNKKAEIINALGTVLGNKFGVAFLSEDWKKRGRSEKAARMVNERNIYRQAYCGCRYSLEDYETKSCPR